MTDSDWVAEMTRLDPRECADAGCVRRPEWIDRRGRAWCEDHAAAATANPCKRCALPREEQSQATFGHARNCKWVLRGPIINSVPR